MKPYAVKLVDVDDWREFPNAETLHEALTEFAQAIAITTHGGWLRTRRDLRTASEHKRTECVDVRSRDGSVTSCRLKITATVTLAVTFE